MRRGIIMFLLCCFFFAHLFLQAAPTSPNGDIIELKQLDDFKFSALVFGDEFYRRFEYNDYSIIQDSDRNWCYAILKNGEYSPSNFVVGKDLPQGIEKNLLEHQDIISIKFNKAYNLMRVESGFEKEYLDFKKSRVEFLENNQPGTRSPRPVSIPENVTGLCILVDFSDEEANVNIPYNKIESMMNKVNYSDSTNKSSVYDYYYNQSSGKLKLKQIVTGYVRVPKTKSEYDGPKDGNISNKVWGFVRDVIAELKKQQPDLDYSALTLGGSGFPISVSIFYTGGNGAGDLWPHSWSVNNTFPVLTDKIFVYNYQISSIGNTNPTIGTFCHESGHMVCKFWDYYDYGDATRYNNNGDAIKSYGIGSHCLMSSGNYNGQNGAPAPISAYLKNIMGWGTCKNLSGLGNYEVSALENEYFKYANPKNNKEYFLIENRKKGTSNPYQNALPAEGLAIWHIDESVTTMNEYQQMTEMQHYECSLEQADGLFNLEKVKNNGGNNGDANDYFGTNQKRNFNSLTTPNSNWWDGSISGLAITDISAPAEIISFKLSVNNASFLGLENDTIYALSTSAKKKVKLFNRGGSLLNWTVVSDSSWLKVFPSNGGTINMNSFVEIELNLEENVTANLRSGTITFMSNSQNLINSPQILKIFQQENFSVALDNSSLEFENISDISWRTVEDSTAVDGKSLKSGEILNSETTAFFTELKGPGFFSFSYKVSTEMRYDSFNFYVNNSLIHSDSGLKKASWLNHIELIPNEISSLRFEYKKDADIFSADDAVWLDNFKYKELKIIISGIYTGGGEENSIYKNDYIEIFNNTNSEIDLTNYTLIFAENVATNASKKNTFKFPENSKIGAKRFALIKCGGGESGVVWSEQIFDFDASGSDGKNMSLATESGKILLFNNEIDLSAVNSISENVTEIMFLPNLENYLPYGVTATPIYGKAAMNVNLGHNTAMKRKYNLATKIIDFSADLNVDYEVVDIGENTPRNSRFINTKMATPENVAQIFLEATNSQVDCIILSSGNYTEQLFFNPQKATLLIGNKNTIINNISIGKKCTISRCVIKKLTTSENINLYRCTLINISFKNPEKISAYSTLFWQCSGIENLAIKENCASDSFSHKINTIDSQGNLKLDPNNSPIDSVNYMLKPGSHLINRGTIKNFNP